MATDQLASAVDDLGPNDELDLCDFSEGDSDLFCSEADAPAQSRMPKLRGVPKPGTRASNLKPAVRAPKTGHDIVDLGPAATEHLKKIAHVEAVSVPADRIRPTQLSLSGYKLRVMRLAIRNGTYKPEPVLTSREDYLLDGHTRWAAQVAEGVKSIAVERVDMPVLRALKEIQTFADSQGIEQPF